MLQSLGISLRWLLTTKVLALSKHTLPLVGSRSLEGISSRSFSRGSWLCTALLLFLVFATLVTTFVATSGISGLLVSLGSFLSELVKLLLGELALGSTLSSGSTSLLLSALLVTLTLSGLSGIDGVANDTHTLGLTIGDKVDNHLAADHVDLVHNVETAALELEVRANVEGPQDTFSDADILITRVFVEDRLIIVILLNLLFGDEVIELDHLELNGGCWVVADPSYLSRLLEVLVIFIDGSKKLKAVTIDDLARDCRVAPLHERHLLSLLKSLSISALND